MAIQFGAVRGVQTRYRLHRVVGGSGSGLAAWFAVRPVWIWLPAVLLALAVLWQAA